MPNRLRKRAFDEYYDWTGPWISDGKWQASTPGFTTPRSEWEAEGKDHDIVWGTSNNRADIEAADQKYYNNNIGKGAWRSAAAIAVKYGGPVLRLGRRFEDDKPILRGTMKRLRSETKLPPRKHAKTTMSKALVPVNAPTAAAAAPLRLRGGAGGGGTGGTMGETPVKPHGPVALIQADYQTLRHKWVSTFDIGSTTGALVKKELRLNSPIDPNITITTAANETNARFNGFNEMAGRYRYYRLLQNHVTITFVRNEPVTDHGTDVAALNARLKHSGPLIFGYILNPSNRFEVMSSSVTNWRQMAQARFCDWKVVQGHDGRYTFSYTYTPGQWDATIAEEQKEKLWIPVNEHQSPDDRMMIFMQPLDVATDFNGVIIITMDATIQYREWDNQIVERMFLFDWKADTAGEEVTPGETTAFTATTDPVPTPDEYPEMEEDL